MLNYGLLDTWSVHRFFFILKIFFTISFKQKQVWHDIFWKISYFISIFEISPISLGHTDLWLTIAKEKEKVGEIFKMKK